MNNDLQQAIIDLRTKAAQYDRPERYYNGEHDLKFATEKFETTFGTLFREFALNLCPVVCDAVRDKLRVNGFSVDSYEVAELQSYEVSGTQTSTDSRNSATSITSQTRRIWHTNRMAVRSGEVHKEVLKTGDAYVIVWPDESGLARIFPNRASQTSVTYDEDFPGRVIRAAKYWLGADRHVRLNLFYPDRIEKYISKARSEGSLPEASGFAALSSKFKVQSSKSGHDSKTLNFELETLNSDSAVPNPFGVVPVFHFANNADLGTHGRSELEAAIPVQDGLNKSVLDMLVAMEYSSFRQRWVAGIEIDYDEQGNAITPFKNGIDNLWVAGKDARFGDFEPAELEQFLKVKDSFRVDIASVTGTPLHYFLQQSHEVASGESIKRSETRFLAKVRDRQAAFGQVWADVMAFALQIEGIPGTQLTTEWEDPSPITERERLENEILKMQIERSSRSDATRALPTR